MTRTTFTNENNTKDGAAIIRRSRNNTITLFEQLHLLGVAVCIISFIIADNNNKQRNFFCNGFAVVPPPTCKLNVGGHVYELSVSLLDVFPTTKLTRSVYEMFQKQQESNNGDDDSKATTVVEPILFIDRDGERFRYIVDYMRDDTVHLPLSISKESFITDLQYYGFTNIRSDTIHVPTETATLVPNKDIGRRILQLIQEREERIASIRNQLHEATMLEITNYCFGQVIMKRTMEIELPKEYNNFIANQFDVALFNTCIHDFGLSLVDCYVVGQGYVVQLQTLNDNTGSTKDDDDTEEDIMNNLYTKKIDPIASLKGSVEID